MIKIDDKTCIGCGACVSLCPRCFQMNEQGLAEPTGEAADEAAQEAAASCPVAAIIIEEE